MGVRICWTFLNPEIQLQSSSEQACSCIRQSAQRWKTKKLENEMENASYKTYISKSIELYVCQVLFLSVAICLILEQVDTNWFIRNHFRTFLCESSISYSQKLWEMARAMSKPLNTLDCNC